MSRSIVFYFQMHQPYRVKRYTIFDASHDHIYFNDEGVADTNNQRIFLRVAEKSYRPMLARLARLAEQHSEFTFTLSMSGTFIEQAKEWAPDIIDSIKQLVDAKRVELLAETYHHSLAFFYSRREFEQEVLLHRDTIFQTFGVVPSVFRNTELAYSDELASWVSDHNYRGVIAEGWDDILGWRSPNHLYQAAHTNSLALLLKNYRLSDDLAFRFGDSGWSSSTLTPADYIQRIQTSDPSGDLINLFMDFETFGEHQWESAGIFEFFSEFVTQWIQSGGTFATASQAIRDHQPVDTVTMPHVVTWADSERDLSAWNGNALQREALKYVYELEPDVLQTEDEALIADWRKLLTSDHTYYMSTKYQQDGDVHAYFSPYDSPYDAFLSYMNVIRDMRWRIGRHRRSL